MPVVYSGVPVRHLPYTLQICNLHQVRGGYTGHLHNNEEKSMKLLLIEDDLRLADYLKKGLTEEGFVVDLARNGIDGLHLATQGLYEVIVLDGMLPDIDGLAVLSALRQSKSIPVLMLTARAMVEDRVSGLKAGADDYLVKPFAFAELVARLHALGRRTSTVAIESQTTLLTLLDLELDLSLIHI